ncbi:hypothetical protein BDF14DRAFT_1759376 [Spinellus fusiger]|nr:hypothetical protein BDF14DRAFT_1759376 [Spinellus fusiger]
MFSNILTPAFLLIASTYAVSCGNNHKAWVWNCQTILDNWSLDDNIIYSADTDNCLAKYNDKYGGYVCILAQDDSCALSIAISAKTPGGGRQGSELKQFVQDSINQCSSGNLVSASDGNSINFYSQKMCLSNSGSTSSC